jgi:hypothetical protein
LGSELGLLLLIRSIRASDVDKDWNERFERAQRKPRHWRIAVGVLLIGIEAKNHLAPDPNLLAADNPSQQLGMNVAAVLIVALSCWLIYSGFKPKKVSIPKDPPTAGNN